MLGKCLMAGAALAATPAIAEESRTFDFMGYTAGVPLAPEQTKRCTKGQESECPVTYGKVSDVNVSYMVRLYDNQLSGILITTNISGFPRLLEAFKMKYGTPCEEKTSTLGNAMGAKVQNAEVYWCFATGRLMLSKYGTKIDQTVALYTDKNKKPQPQPVVNF